MVLKRRIGRQHKHVVFAGQARQRRALRERDRLAAGDDAAQHHGAHHHHGVRVALLVEELGQAQGAGGAALVFIGHAVGRLGVQQGLAQGAAGGVPATAGVGGDHHLEVGCRMGGQRQGAGGRQGCHGFEEGIATHGKVSLGF
jgi:hypothetical protein